VKYLIVLTLALSGLSAQAQLQAASQDSLDAWFDDGGISTTKNMVAWHITGLVSGQFGFSYYRSFGSGITGIEIGLAYVMPYYGNNLMSFRVGDGTSISDQDLNLGSGVALEINFRYTMFSDKQLLDRWYSSIFIHSRSNSYEPDEILNDTGIGYKVGYIWTPMDRVGVDITSGIAARFVQAEDSNIYLWIPLQVKAGWTF
jgi:hypothetical protein